MTDFFDRAQEREQIFRTDAIELTRQRLQVEGADDCEGCGEPIDAARRAVLPSARRCVTCQEAAERRGYLGKVAG